MFKNNRQKPLLFNHRMKFMLNRGIFTSCKAYLKITTKTAPFFPASRGPFSFLFAELTGGNTKEKGPLLTGKLLLKPPYEIKGKSNMLLNKT